MNLCVLFYMRIINLKKFIIWFVGLKMLSFGIWVISKKYTRFRFYIVWWKGEWYDNYQKEIFRFFYSHISYFIFLFLSANNNQTKVLMRILLDGEYNGDDVFIFRKSFKKRKLYLLTIIHLFISVYLFRVMNLLFLLTSPNANVSEIIFSRNLKQTEPCYRWKYN